MKTLLLYTSLLLIFLPGGRLNAQAGFPHIATVALDISTAGWNKLLLMHNGNTVLFHLEKNRDVIIKTFDAQHNELGSLKPVLKYLDEALINEDIFKGVYEIGGQAVLFMQQTMDNHQVLIRVVVDPVSAKVVKEDVILQSVSFADRSDFFVLKPENTEGYAVFCYRLPQYKGDKTMKCCLYSEQHEKVKTASLDFPYPDASDIKLLGMNVAPNGVAYILLYCRTVKDSADQGHLLLASWRGNDDGFHIQDVITETSIEPQYAVFSPELFGNDVMALVTASVSYMKEGEKAGAHHTEFLGMALRISASTSHVKRVVVLAAANTELSLNEEAKKLPFFNGTDLTLFISEAGELNIVSQEIFANDLVTFSTGKREYNTI